mmetsp:Transcript_40390/g.75560  ORF Transcript_40390/g.75560 Transcript_40390/m.75560 type:complete len:530 (+) Transcript_40390:86-1675(+)
MQCFEFLWRLPLAKHGQRLALADTVDALATGSHQAAPRSLGPSSAESAAAGTVVGPAAARHQAVQQGLEQLQRPRQERTGAEVGLRGSAALAIVAVVIAVVLAMIDLKKEVNSSGEESLATTGLEMIDLKKEVAALGDEVKTRTSQLELWQKRLPWRRGRQHDALLPHWVQRLLVEESPGARRGFVVVTPHFGIGNRLLGAVSAAALALALNYSLSIIWEDPRFHDVLGVHGVEARAVVPAYTERGALELDMQGMSRNLHKAANELACGSGSWSNESASVLHITTDQFFLPLLQLGGEQSHRTALQHVLGSTDSQHEDAATELETWSHALLTGIFQFGPAFRERVEAEAGRLLSGASFVLGVHVRTRMYDFEKATVPELPLPELLQCVQEAFAAEAPAASKAAVIFLATPSELAKTAFRREFGERLRTREGIETDRLKPEGDLEAVIDLALLATSDALVTSVHSTFGYVAQALARVRPYVVAAGKPHCTRAVTTSPCFHLGERLLGKLECEPPPDVLRRAHGTWASCWF